MTGVIFSMARKVTDWSDWERFAHKNPVKNHHDYASQPVMIVYERDQPQVCYPPCFCIKAGVKIRYVYEFCLISLKDGHVHGVLVPVYVRIGRLFLGMKKPQVLRWGWAGLLD